MLASNESPYPPIPAVIEAVTKVLAGLNRYPDPTNAALRAAVRPPRRAGQPDRDRQRLLRHPARRRRRAARARRRARLRVAELLGLPAPRGGLGRARDRGPAGRRHRHDLDAMREEITAATRLVLVCNPNNPTSTALPLDEIADFVADVPRHVARDPRRGLRRVQHAAGPRRVGRPAQAAPEPRAAADVLQGLRAVRAARRLRRCAARRSSGPRSTRCASRSSATPPRRPRRSRRSTTRTRSPAASSATSPSGSGSRTGCASSGIEPAESQANFVWFDLGEDDEPADVCARSWPRRARHPRARRRRARARRRAARHGRHAGRERALPGSACRAAFAPVASPQTRNGVPHPRPARGAVGRAGA